MSFHPENKGEKRNRLKETQLASVGMKGCIFGLLPRMYYLGRNSLDAQKSRSRPGELPLGWKIKSTITVTHSRVRLCLASTSFR